MIMEIFSTVFVILTILTELRKEAQIWLRIMDSHHTYRLDLECMLIPTVEMEIITSSNRGIEAQWVEILSE